MAQETWVIEFLSAMEFSHGGRFVDDNGNAVMRMAAARSALRWLVDAVHKTRSSRLRASKPANWPA